MTFMQRVLTTQPKLCIISGAEQLQRGFLWTVATAATESVSITEYRTNGITERTQFVWLCFCYIQIVFALSAHNSSCGETAEKSNLKGILKGYLTMTDIDPLIRGFFHAQDALTAAASNNAGTIIWQIVLQIVLIALNAVFACAEIAVLSVSDAKLAILVDSGNKRANALQS